MEFYDPDIQFFDEECPKCGAMLYYRECSACGGDGYFDCYEDDPINYSPGEEDEPCSECNGHGREIWCRKCGWDYLEKQYLNGKSELEAAEQVAEHRPEKRGTQLEAN